MVIDFSYDAHDFLDLHNNFRFIILVQELCGSLISGRIRDLKYVQNIISYRVQHFKELINIDDSIVVFINSGWINTCLKISNIAYHQSSA